MSIEISNRVQALNESSTLKLNSRAIELAATGRFIYNFTAGQLPSRPAGDFVEALKEELRFLKSYQYSPVAGIPALREKLLKRHLHLRGLEDLDSSRLDCLVGNGGKSVISNLLTTLVNPGDEVVLLAPYWISYPEMIQLCQGKPVVVSSTLFDEFVPSLEHIKEAITSKTKAIIINSPNNPAGIHYSDEWMEGLSQLLLDNPHVAIISDEIYHLLNYFDPAPRYFYQYAPELLERTFIVDGISKSLASTGLRVGFALGPKEALKSVSKLQGQTASGASSLIQRGMLSFNWDKIDDFIRPLKDHLRSNASIVREAFRTNGLGHCWYQPASAFYFLIDLGRTPLFEKMKAEHDDQDLSDLICEKLLETEGIALVPGPAFGVPNSARLSMVMDSAPFEEGILKLIKALNNK